MEECPGGVELQQDIWVISVSCFNFSLLENNYSPSFWQPQQQYYILYEYKYKNYTIKKMSWK